MLDLSCIFSKVSPSIDCSVKTFGKAGMEMSEIFLQNFLSFCEGTSESILKV